MYERLAILEGHWDLNVDTGKFHLRVLPELKIFGSSGKSHTSAFTSYFNTLGNQSLSEVINANYFMYQQKIGFGFQDSKLNFDPVTNIGVMDLVELDASAAPRLVVHNLGKFQDELDALNVYLIISKSVVLSMCRYGESHFTADLEELADSAEPGIETDVVAALKRLIPPGEKE